MRLCGQRVKGQVMTRPNMVKNAEAYVNRRVFFVLFFVNFINFQSRLHGRLSWLRVGLSYRICLLVCSVALQCHDMPCG